MKCHNCGENLIPEACFCSACGTKVISQNTPEQKSIEPQRLLPIQPKPNKAESTPVTETVSAAEHATVTEYMPNQQPVPEPYPTPSPFAEYVQPTYTGKKKSKKKLIIVLSILLAVIAVAGLAAFLLWDKISFTMSPEDYSYNLVEDAYEEMLDDLDKAEQNLLGFDLSLDTPITVNVVYAESDNEYGEYTENSAKITVSNNPSDEEMLASAAIDDGYELMKVEGFINDSYLGFRLPEVHDDFKVVPSDDFGKKLVNSNGALGDMLKSNSVNTIALKYLEDLDLSYDTIINYLQGNSKVQKEVERILSDEIVDFFENCNISDKKDVQFAFDNGTVDAESYEIKINGEAVLDFAEDVLDEIQESRVLKEALGNEAVSMLSLAKLSLKDVDLSDFPENFTVTLVEYDARLVEVTFEISVSDSQSDFIDKYNSQARVSLKATDKNSILGGIKIISETRSDSVYSDDDEYSNNQKTEISLTSNWLDNDEKIYFKLDFNNASTGYYVYDGEKEEYSYSDYGDMKLELDLEEGTWSFVVTDEGETMIQYDGTCRKTDSGFEFDYHLDYTDTYYEYDEMIEYDEWLEGKFNAYRSEYLRSMYNDSGYSNYYEWLDEQSYRYSYYSSYFEDWIYEKLADSYTEKYDPYYDYDNAYDLYWDEEEAEVAYEYDGTKDFKLRIANKSELTFKKGDHDNILDWSENDFESYGRDVANAY